MQNLYSIVINPPPTIVSTLATLKKQLASKAGWFSSANSDAHITFSEFYADAAKISRVKAQLARLSSAEAGLQLNFDNICNYENGACFIAPSVASKQELKELMKRIQKGMTIKTRHKSYSPHMSIGRNLDEEQSEAAGKMFTNVQMNFYCDRIALRVFNEDSKQFTILEEFLFLNIPSQEEQLALF